MSVQVTVKMLLFIMSRCPFLYYFTRLGTFLFSSRNNFTFHVRESTVVTTIFILEVRDMLIYKKNNKT